MEKIHASESVQRIFGESFIRLLTRIGCVLLDTTDLGKYLEQIKKQKPNIWETKSVNIDGVSFSLTPEQVGELVGYLTVLEYK